tara:strand:+ start:363 stop:704 length:342 start_codon:yes stop_codon:yes gene_type:complete
MGKSQRDKGARVERKVLKLFTDAGYQGKRIGFLPQMGIPVLGDLLIGGKTFEVKARKNGEGFKMLHNWLGENYALVLVADGKEPLIVQTFSEWTNPKGIINDKQIRNYPGIDI